jgi:transposase
VTRYVGLDVHKSVVQSAIVDRRGRQTASDRFGCSRAELELYAKTQLRPTDHVALEATTNTWGIVEVLEPFVQEVVVSNPMRTKAIASAKIKTDKVDALVLAQLLRADYLPRVWQPPPEVRAARSITSRRGALIADRTAVKNRIHAVLRQRLIHAPDRLFEPKGLAWLAKVRLEPTDRAAIDSELRLLDVYDQEIDTINQTLLERSADSADVKLLVTLPGIDVAVGQTLSAVLGEIKRFPDPDSAASYVGLVPSTRQSANHCAHGPITKQGNSRARWLLVQAAQNVADHPGPLGAFFRRIAKKRNRNIAVVATARKLVVIAWHMLTQREPYRYATPAVTEAKLRRIRTSRGERRRAKPGAVRTRRDPSNPQRVSRRISSLPEVYESEGLPAISEPAKGERKMLAEKKLDLVAKKLLSDQWVPRAPRRKTLTSSRKAVKKPLTRT